MQKSLLLKAASIALIFGVLLVPLRMIDGLVAERASRQQAVVQELAGMSYGQQVVSGPVLATSYVEKYADEVTENRVRRVETRQRDRVARFFPVTNAFEGSAIVEVKSRGLFKARVFARGGNG